MKYKRLKMCVFLLSGLSLAVLQAQNTVPAAGGVASGSGGSVSYSVGQVVYTTHSGTTGTLAQGVQQGYEITVETGIEEAEGITLIVSVYPNPTGDFLTLKVRNYTNEELIYQLYNMNGRLLESENLTENETNISMSNLLPASYFLKVINHNKEIKTFKIIKK
jgi:hypothetical protein